MRKQFLKPMICLLAFMLLPGLPGSQASDSKELKVGFIYVSTSHDGGWSHSHEKGRSLLEKLPNVKTRFVESVREGDETYLDAILLHMAKSGYGLIFATSYGYINSINKIAPEFPKTIFMHCSGNVLSSNIGTYFGKIYEARYLSGLVAGGMTQSNVIGFVAAFPIPEVVRGINAFALGVREVNPEAKVLVQWTLNWNSPKKEKEVAQKLIQLEADVLAQHQDSPATQIVASKNGVYSIGYHQDMSPYAPKGHLTAPIWNWGPVYKHVVEQVKAGQWKSENIWWGLKEGVVELAPFGDSVPEELRKRVLDRKRDIAQENFSVFSGPILDQAGTVKIQEGRKATNEELLGMNWFVQGVVGSPKP